MNHSVIRFATAFSLLCISVSSHATRTIRTDAPALNGANDWVSSTTTPPSLFGISALNPGISTTGMATLSYSPNGTDFYTNLQLSNAVQYDYYNSSSLNPNSIVEQVLVYQLGAGNTPSNASTALASGDFAVELNYDPSNTSITQGTAKFTIGGVTYSSLGTGLPINTENDFLFSSTGAFIGVLTLDGSTTLTTGLSAPAGWTATPAVSAPEMRLSSSATSLTMLFGALALLRGRRRVKASPERLAQHELV